MVSVENNDSAGSEMWNPGCQGRGEHDSTSHTHSSSDTGSWRLKFITFHGVELRVIRIRHAALLGLVCAHCRGKETLGSGAVPAKLPPPPSPAQAGQGSQSIKNKFKKKKKFHFPPQSPSITLICPMNERVIQLRLWNSSTLSLHSQGS